jgi:hypothetical protein
VAALALLIGVGIGQQAAGSRAAAQEPAAVIFGFVSVAAGQPAPTRVRALVGETVCGTSGPLAQVEGALLLYTLVVARAGEKAGCGFDGATVRLQLLAGEIDAGVPAAQVLWRQGIARVDLSSVAVTGGVFVGELPAGPGLAQLRWTGQSGTSVVAALATLRREAVAVYHWNTQRQQFDSYVVGAPREASSYAVVDADDIVFVRVK